MGPFKLHWRHLHLRSSHNPHKVSRWHTVRRPWYSACAFSNEAKKAGLKVQWENARIADSRLCACRYNGAQKGITHLSFRVSGDVNRLNMARWIETAVCCGTSDGVLPWAVDWRALSKVVWSIDGVLLSDKRIKHSCILILWSAWLSLSGWYGRFDRTCLHQPGQRADGTEAL